MKRHYFHSLLIAVSLLFYHCAQVAPLTGGAKDIAPPKLTGSQPLNAQANFTGNSITLTFDEFVQVKDLQNQLIITPSLKTEPDIVAEGKKVKIKLKPEELLPNTTYRLFFGRAIVDMTEGNALEGFEYIFSTGNTIDSLRLSGNLINAFNNIPVKDGVVVLYPSDSGDSAIYNTQPHYIAKPNSSGAFEINYLPKRSFKLFAITDKNKNYKYDGEEEQVAFHKPSLIPGKDSAVTLSLFHDAGGKLYPKKTFSPQNGLLHIIYNRKSFFDVVSLSKDVRFTEKDPGREKDTVTVYYFAGAADSVTFKIKEINGRSQDTVGILIPKINANRKKMLLLSPNINNGTLPFKQQLMLNFSAMPDTVYSGKLNNKVRLYERNDSGMVSVAGKLNYVLPAGLKIIADLKPGKMYTLKVDTAAFYDFNGRYNDSLTLNFKTQSKDELGKLTINLKVSKKQSYVIQLLNEQDKIVREQYKHFALNASSSESIEFSDVLPATYKVRIVFDDNENRKWDSGELMRKLQPEKVFMHPKVIKVLPDWELEEDVNVF